jgi:hypothetical protein
LVRSYKDGGNVRRLVIEDSRAQGELITMFDAPEPALQWSFYPEVTLAE